MTIEPKIPGAVIPRGVFTQSGSKAASSLRAACQLPPAADMPISSRHQQPRHLNSKPFTARAAGMPRAPPALFVHEPEQVTLTPIWLRRRALLRTSTKEYRYREWRSGRETLVVAPYFATKTLKR